ncbi:MAG: prolyl oligopeptidase family serine peptidase [Burkholderiaceae bacterium]
MNLTWRGALALLTILTMNTSPAPVHAQAPASAATLRMAPEPHDPYTALEDVQAEAALAWVRQRNAQSEAVLQADARYAALQRELREVLDAQDRIPTVSRRGDWLYNFWQDARHPRGIWRRTTLAEYRKAEPKWELLLDVDALGKAEGQSWVWQGSSCLSAQSTRCLVALSPGGSDASVVREFDLGTRAFVKDGFVLPLSKSRWTWLDADTLLVGTATPADPVTDSGYPRAIRLWKRGTPLAEAPVVFEGQQSDVWASAGSDRTPGHERAFVMRGIDFYRHEMFLLQGTDLKKVPKPDEAQVTFWKDRVLMRLRTAWRVGEQQWPAGSLLVMPVASLMAGQPEPVALFTPTAHRSLAGFTTTATSVVLNVMQDVTGRLEVRRPEGSEGRTWSTRTLPVPNTGTVAVAALHDPSLKDDAWAEGLLVTYTDLLTPESLLLAQADRAGIENLKARQGLFPTQGLRLEQRFALSRDGTRIPYFIVTPKGQPRDAGPRPTLLYGYGGFEISMRSTYSGGIGRGWLARGGVYVLANIRGGGEYGPQWHRSAIRENKQRSYDDFIAVAEDLVRTGVTTPAQLGIRGGSNGGLLVGAVMTQRPDLFGAVVCQVPLLDMRRFHRLLAGASWMAEYGNPDREEDWAFISRYSPYHHIPPASGEGSKKLPPMLLVTSTKDDRVHPGHARKMAARLSERGQPVLYWENMEGGHGGAADNGQRAKMQALEYTFLWRQLQGEAK